MALITMIDDMVINAMFNNNQCSCVYDNEAQTQELAIQVSNGAAEQQLSGVIVNRIPKTGGNIFSGDAVFQFSNGSLQNDNVDDGLAARGITAPPRLSQQYDVN